MEQGEGRESKKDGERDSRGSFELELRLVRGEPFREGFRCVVPVTSLVRVGIPAKREMRTRVRTKDSFLIHISRLLGLQRPWHTIAPHFPVARFEMGGVEPDSW